MRKLMLVLAIAALAMTGCASKHMERAATGQNEVVLAKNQAGIVFFRDTTLGGGIQAPVVESLEKDVAFVGIVSANTKLLHKTTPGRHVYVVGGEGSNRLVADLAPQKFYYVRVSPKMGFWKARFVFEPVFITDEKLPKALSGCQWVVKGATAQAWFIHHKNNLQGKSEAAAAKKSGADLKAENGSDRLIQ